MKQDITKEVKIEENANVVIEGKKIVVSGPLGKVEREFPYAFITIEKKDNLIILTTKNATKREKKIIGTITAHIKNMIFGVINGYEYKLQICSVHFPITASIDASKKKVLVKNFIGETKERKSEILDNATVKISGDMITVSSVDKEAAAQTAANIEMCTKIRSRDRRVFQDGVFITEKAGSKI